MTGTERADTVMFGRIARRVEDILSAAKDREHRGQALALDIDARFRLEDLGAVQFQVASAILEESAGLRQEEVVGELLSLGLAAVLGNAAKMVGQVPSGERGHAELPDGETASLMELGSLQPHGSAPWDAPRVLN